MSEFDPIAEARGWARPYTSVQWAWVRALHVEPSAVWHGEPKRKRKPDASWRDMRDAMCQRHGMRGL